MAADGSVLPRKTEVRTSKLIQLSDCNLHSNTLLGGQLLKWMDIVACLAGNISLTFAVLLLSPSLPTGMLGCGGGGCTPTILLLHDVMQ